MNGKKQTPFGTPTHGKHAYSEFSHLSPSNIDFALQVTSTFSSDKSFPHDQKKSTRSSTSKMNVKKTCNRPECKEISNLISETLEKNSLEKENILNSGKWLFNELERLEQLITIIEGEEKQYKFENNNMEKSVSHLNHILHVLEKQKLEQQQERDQFNSKLMTYETEKQRVICDLKCSEELLLDMLWKRESRINASLLEPLQHSPININFQKRKKEIFPTGNLKSNYTNLSRSDVLDVSELSLKNSSMRSALVIAATGYNQILSINSRSSRRTSTSTSNSRLNRISSDLSTDLSNMSLSSDSLSFRSISPLRRYPTTTYGFGLSTRSNNRNNNRSKRSKPVLHTIAQI